MNEIIIDLVIPADEYLALYRGVARDVVATSRDGRRVRFPANILQQYVKHEGVKGTFRISFDQNNKFHSIRQIG